MDGRGLVDIMASNIERFDLFRDVKPYYGDPRLYEARGDIPTLYSLSLKSVVENSVELNSIPSSLKSEVQLCKKYEDFSGPRIIKCSKCQKFYSKQKKYVKHKCDV